MKAAAATAAKASTPPAAPPPLPAAAPAPPPDTAPSEVRPLRPLSPSQVGLAEHQIRHHVITLSLTQCFEDCLRPEFWANITDRLRVCDKVDVFNARNDFYAELIIRSVTPSSSVRGTKGGARVHVLRYVEFEPLERKAKAIEYTVEFRGPASLWCAIRASDGAIVKSHMDSRELAERHVVSMSAATL